MRTVDVELKWDLEQGTAICLDEAYCWIATIRVPSTPMPANTRYLLVGIEDYTAISHLQQTGLLKCNAPTPIATNAV